MSFVDFKEVANVDAGDTIHYGSDQLKEILQIFNNKIVSSRRPTIKNPFRFTDHIEIQAPAVLPTAPTTSNTVNLVVDPADFHLKVQQNGGTLTDLNIFALETNVLSYASPASNVAGDLLKNNGTKYVRLARGANGQALISGASDVSWGMISNSSVSSTAAIAWSKLDKTGSQIKDLADASGLSPTNGQVPTWNSSTSQWIAQTPPGSATGEANTASNQGTGGVGPFNAKVGVDLQFKNINAASTKITVTNNTGSKTIDLDVAQANLTLSSIGGAVTDSQTPSAPTGKTYNIDSNTLKHSTTNAQGDILAYDTTTTKYIRIPRGTNGQYLKSTATDIAWSPLTVPNVFGGINTQSGNGSTKIFNIAHGAGTTPTKYSVTTVSQSASVDQNLGLTYGAQSMIWVTADATNLILNYQYAPPSGTNNLQWAWLVFT